MNSSTLSNETEMNKPEEQKILENEQIRRMSEEIAHSNSIESKDLSKNNSIKSDVKSIDHGTTNNNNITNNSSTLSPTIENNSASGIGNNSKQSELLSVERYNWLYHIRFVRNEFDQCLNEMNHLSNTNTHGVTTEYSLYLSGLINLRRGNAKSALHQFNLLRSINNPTYIKAIARCLLILGKHQNVCDIVREFGLKVCQNDPSHLWTLYGYALHFLGSMSQAKEAFQNAIQGTNNQVEPFIALAKCHIAEGDYKSAIFVLRRATEISPNDVQLAIKLGVLLYTTGIVTKGIEKILEADGQTPIVSAGSDLPLTIAVGTIMQEIRQDVDGAFQRYRQCDVFECPSLWNNIAVCFSIKSKYVAAITCLKKAFFLQPLDWRINYNLGLINLKLKQYASAFHFFKNSVTFCGGTNPNLLTLLAICLDFLSDKANSYQAHQTAIKMNEPTSAIALINFAIFLYNSETQSENRNLIIELMMEFEKCWLKRKSNSSEFDENVMKSATVLAQELNLSNHLSWLKSDLPSSTGDSLILSNVSNEQQQQQQPQSQSIASSISQDV